MGGASERLLEQARPHRPRRPGGRELRVEALGAGGLLVVAGGMALLVASSRPLAPAILALDAALYAAL